MGVGICILITDGDKRLSRLCRETVQDKTGGDPGIPSENCMRLISKKVPPGNIRQNPLGCKIL
jgi:hypothetical protein